MQTLSKHAYIIDIESFVFPFHPAPNTLSVQQRHALDNGHIARATNKILDFLRERQIKLTFAVVAEIYEWTPALLEKIAQDGHEIGYHGHTHRMIRNLDILEEELTLSKRFFEIFRPVCYQAPTIYFPQGGFRLLREAGFRYSNTVYQGMPYMIDGIMEIPVSTLHPDSPAPRRYPGHMTLPLVLTNYPFGSGLFTALLPKRRLFACYQKYHDAGLPTVTFIHDWQVVDMAALKSPHIFWKKITSPLHIPYTWNIWEKFCALLERFPFTTMAAIYHDWQNRLCPDAP